MILNIYDILKNTRKNIKINTKLARAQIGAPHASDEATKEYQVINHRENIAKKIQFKINTEVQTRKLTVVEQVDITPTLAEEIGDTDQASSNDNKYVPLRANKQQINVN